MERRATHRRPSYRRGGVLIETGSIQRRRSILKAGLIKRLKERGDNKEILGDQTAPKTKKGEAYIDEDIFTREGKNRAEK